MYIIVLCGFCVSAGPARAAIVYDDGAVHEISTAVYRIEIYDSLAGDPTVVKLLAGAGVWDVDVYNNSRFLMFDGTLGGTLALHDHSQAVISGGVVDEDPFYLTDSSRLTITGGYVDEALRI